MAETVARQLNNRFSVVPPEFYGKGCSVQFQSGGKRCRSSKVLTAALLSTREAVLGNDCTTSYTDFTSELKYSRATIARDIAELTASDGAFKRTRQSKYVAVFEFDTKRGLPVYHFLRAETFNGIRLTGNDVIFASNVIRHYLNESREQKYFIGGEKRVSSFLGVAISTAHGVIYRLMKAGIMRRFVMHDGKLDTGKGINNDYQTVYVIDDEILKRVKAIRKEISRQNTEKEAVKLLFTVKAEPKRADEQQNLSADVHYDKYALPEYKFQKLEAAFSSDKIYQDIRQRYLQLKTVWFDKLKEQDFDSADELEDELNNVADELKCYLQSRGAPPEDIPVNIWEYIK